MITKETTIETIELTAEDMVLIRERIAIMEDGEEIGHHYEQRHILKGDDYSAETDRIKAVCSAVFGV